MAEVLTRKRADEQYQAAAAALVKAREVKQLADEAGAAAARKLGEAEKAVQQAELDLRHQVAPELHPHPVPMGEPASRRPEGCEACAQLPPEGRGGRR